MEPPKVTVVDLVDFHSTEIETSKVLQNVSNKNLMRFPLNHYCWYEIFERLHRLQDHINLAESYAGLWEAADRIYRSRYNGIAIDFKRSLDISRIMYHVGPFVRSLALKLSDKANYTVENLLSIQKECKQLKHLALIEFDRSEHNDHPFEDHFSDTLETLFLSSCSLANDDNFFESFTIRKSLTMLGCENISVTAMQRCCEKNPQIESFACNSRTLDYSKFVPLLPNLKRLGLTYDTEILEPKFLSTLQSSRKLALDCVDGDINEVLLRITLNGKINLDELELNNVVFDEYTFEILATFGKLRRLIVSTSRTYQFLPTDKLPRKLRVLMLDGFHFCEQGFNLFFQKEIQNVRLSRCGYLKVNDDSVDEWVERRNKHKENGKINYAKGEAKGNVDKKLSETESKITLGDFSDNDFPFNQSRFTFPALNILRLTNIEPEVDTFCNDATKRDYLVNQWEITKI